MPPGPIDNARLLVKGAQPLPNQRPEVHYRGVAPPVWHILHSIYGGGPMLRRAGVDLYKLPFVPPPVQGHAGAVAPGPTADPARNEAQAAQP